MSRKVPETHRGEFTSRFRRGAFGWITGADVWAAYANTMKAAEKAGRGGEVRDRINTLIASETYGGFVTRILGRELGR